jgi:UDP-N-acetyl-D-mannosaminuronic acid dehydrogenase
MSFKTISVLGLGYIGLPTAAIIASRGVNVVGVDVNQSTVDIINQGDVHIVEPDLDDVVRNVVQAGTLRAVAEPEPADVFVIAVPTPFKDEKVPDLQFIKDAGLSIAPMLVKGNLVVLESTSPVGATKKLAGWLAEARPDLSFPHQTGEDSDIRVAHCPERVLPGKVMRELVENDRIIGGMTKSCSLMAKEMYKIFVEGDCLVTDCNTAELCKLTENSFRDVNIAFANELSLVCEKLDVDVWELIALANRHPRVNVLTPGPGVGGHCIAVDPWFIVDSAPAESRLIKTAREVNDFKPDWVVSKVIESVELFRKLNGREPQVACFGLAFKPDIDDLRESPALDIVSRLSVDFNVVAVEPNIEAALSAIELVSVGRGVAADIKVILVGHKEFLSLPLDFNEYTLDFVGISRV